MKAPRVYRHRVPATAARTAIASLIERGHSIADIARASGLHKNKICRIREGVTLSIEPADHEAILDADDRMRAADPDRCARIPADTAQRTILMLREWYSAAEIARESGLTTNKICRIRDRDSKTIEPADHHAIEAALGRFRAQDPRVRYAYAESIRGYHMGMKGVSIVGSMRRLQGLCAEGHDAREIARLLGVNVALVKRWRSGMTTVIIQRRHDDIARLADALTGRPKENRKARSWARRFGWVPLAAWDDIDDPSEVPCTRDTQNATGAILVSRVFRGESSIDILTQDEEASLWRMWDEHCRESLGHAGGVVSFAERMDIAPSRARRIIDRAKVLTAA